MGRLITCTGRYATIPYEIRQAGIHLYSIEELCFYLQKNAFLLDSELITPNLIEWIDTQLEMTELAGTLTQLFRSDGTLEACVCAIMEACHYCTKEELSGLLSVLRENAKLNRHEKKKKQIDYMAAAGRLEQAMLAYEELLQEVSGKDIALSSKIYVSLGCCAAQLFYFSKAEGYFEKAYHLTYRREVLMLWAIAIRLHGTPEEQKKKLLAFSELREIDAEAELQISQALEQWKTTELCRRDQSIQEQWEHERGNEYFEMAGRVTEECKLTYRGLVNA